MDEYNYVNQENKDYEDNLTNIDIEIPMQENYKPFLSFILTSTVDKKLRTESEKLSLHLLFILFLILSNVLLKTLTTTFIQTNINSIEFYRSFFMLLILYTELKYNKIEISPIYKSNYKLQLIFRYIGYFGSMAFFIIASQNIQFNFINALCFISVILTFAIAAIYLKEEFNTKTALLVTICSIVIIIFIYGLLLMNEESTFLAVNSTSIIYKGFMFGFLYALAICILYVSSINTVKEINISLVNFYMAQIGFVLNFFFIFVTFSDFNFNPFYIVLCFVYGFFSYNLYTFFNLSLKSNEIMDVVYYNYFEFVAGNLINLVFDYNSSFNVMSLITSGIVFGILFYSIYKVWSN